MLTKQDKKYLHKNFVTRKEFKTELNKGLQDQFDAVMMEFARMRDEMYEGFGNVKDELKTEILGAIADVMGELKAIREEQTVGSYQLSNHSDQLDNHEARLVKLEESVII